MLTRRVSACVGRWNAAAFRLLMKDYEGFTIEKFEKDFPAVHRCVGVSTCVMPVSRYSCTHDGIS